ncbi:Biopolymer transporter Tol [Pseudoclavibacter sp. 8L]|nr:Biopolymer transporter Tol [Pseudoclavibacter sp. 8L]
MGDDGDESRGGRGAARHGAPAQNGDAARNSGAARGGDGGRGGGAQDGGAAAQDDERWLVVKGRRWRRTDPALPADVVERLKSHLGRGRSGVGAAKRRGDDVAVAAARTRVGLAKHGLGERGPRWWDEPEEARLQRARQALSDLEALDSLDASGG